MGWKHDNKEWNLNWEHPFLKILGYERRSDIKKVGNAEFKVYNSGMMGAQSKFESSCVDYTTSHYYMLRAYKWVLIVEYVMEGSNN